MIGPIDQSLINLRELFSVDDKIYESPESSLGGFQLLHGQCSHG